MPKIHKKITLFLNRCLSVPLSFVKAALSKSFLTHEIVEIKQFESTKKLILLAFQTDLNS